MILPEPALTRPLEVRHQTGHIKNLTGFVLNELSTIPPNSLDNVLNTFSYMFAIIRIINEDSILDNLKWIAVL